VPVHKAVWQAKRGGMKRNEYCIRFSFYGTQMGTQRINYKINLHMLKKEIVVYCYTYPGDMNRLCLTGKMQIFLMFGAKWMWDTRWRSWLRHYVTSRKVAVSIPDSVIGIFY
jgi:hypothetical protein